MTEKHFIGLLFVLGAGAVAGGVGVAWGVGPGLVAAGVALMVIATLWAWGIQ